MIEDLRKEKIFLREKLPWFIREENKKNTAAVTFRISDFFWMLFKYTSPIHTSITPFRGYFRFY